MAKILDADDVATHPDKPLTIDEIKREAAGAGAGVVEPVKHVDKDALKLEAFMAEKVVIQVHASHREGELRAVPVTVNGRRIDILINTPTRVPRAYVEALANAVTTEYAQIVDSHDAANSYLQPNSAQSYSFSVLQDTDRGRKWLETVLRRRG